MPRLWTCALVLCLAGTAWADKQPAATEDKPGCGSHGTAIDFVATPSEAAKQAKKEGKLVFVLHVSGHFEDPRFT